MDNFLTMSEETPLVSLNDTITAQCFSQYEAGVKFRKFRQDAWYKNEDLYLNREKPALKSRIEVRLPIMGGFIDTLLSKTNESPVVRFGHLSDADIRRAKKTTSYWEFDSASTRANWDGSDRDARKMAGLYGRAIYLNYSESKPKYKSYRELVDVYDFFCEPYGGKYLEIHKFLGQDNIWRSKYDLEGNDLYDQNQVKKLLNAQSPEQRKANQKAQEDTKNRLAGLGISGVWQDYTGDDEYRLIQMGTTYHGERYWVVFNPDTKIWLRVEKNRDIYKSDLWCWTSWATHPDPFNFWSKAPADDLRSGCEAIKLFISQAAENRMKQNWGMRGYDAEVWTNPKLLEFRMDGLAPAKLRPGENIQNSIYEFRVGSMTETLELVNFIDNVLGVKTGITASAQGQTDVDAKVGIYYGDMKQVADRLGLVNSNKVEELQQAALLWSWGIWEHLSSGEMVKVVGEKGVEWEELTKEDTEPEFAITIKGGILEVQMDELKKKTKNDALINIKGDPNLAPILNKRLTTEHMLRNAGWEEVDVKLLLDTQNEGNEESVSRAAQAIEDILAKKVPKRYMSADSAFLQRLVDAMDEELEDWQLKAIETYFNAHRDIVAVNMARKAKMKAVSDMLRGPVPVSTSMPRSPIELSPETPQPTNMPNIPMV